MGIEKWWLRKAFDGLDIIPDEVLWRKKEAFSDGVSCNENSWYSIIQNKCKHLDKEDSPTKEASYYKKLFIKHYGKNRLDIIPKYWLPKWNKNGHVKNYIDPSARILQIYNN